MLPCIYTQKHYLEKDVSIYPSFTHPHKKLQNFIPTVSSLSSQEKLNLKNTNKILHAALDNKNLEKLVRETLFNTNLNKFNKYIFSKIINENNKSNKKEIPTILQSQNQTLNLSKPNDMKNSILLFKKEQFKKSDNHLLLNEVDVNFRAKRRWKLAITTVIKIAQALAFANFRTATGDNMRVENTTQFAQEGLTLVLKSFQSKSDVLTIERIKALMTDPIHFRIQSLEKTQQVEKIIANSNCISRYPQTIKAKLSQYMTFEAHKRGTLMIREGHEVLYFYFILSGQCEVFNIRDDVKWRSNILNPGDSFSDISMNGFQTKNIRTASVSCVIDCEFLRINKEDYNEIMLGHQTKLEKTHRKKILENSIAFFKEFEPMDNLNWKQLINRSYIRYFENGSLILTEGEDNEEIFFIISGSVKLMKVVTLEKNSMTNSSKRTVTAPNFSTNTQRNLISATSKVLMQQRPFTCPVEGFLKKEKDIEFKESKINISHEVLKDFKSIKKNEINSSKNLIKSSKKLLPVNCYGSVDTHIQDNKFHNTNKKKGLCMEIDNQIINDNDKKQHKIFKINELSTGKSFPELALPEEAIKAGYIVNDLECLVASSGISLDGRRSRIFDLQSKYIRNELKYKYPSYASVVATGLVKCLVIKRLDFARIASTDMVRKLQKQAEECYIPLEILQNDYKEKQCWNKYKERVVRETVLDFHKIKAQKLYEVQNQEREKKKI